MPLEGLGRREEVGCGYLRECLFKFYRHLSHSRTLDEGNTGGCDAVDASREPPCNREYILWNGEPIRACGNAPSDSGNPPKEAQYFRVAHNTCLRKLSSNLTSRRVLPHYT